jgi:hypothetical protein
MADRKTTTHILTEASLDYLTHMRFSAFKEIGFVKWGRKRADVLAISLKGHLVAHEIKSCMADYTTDKKKWSYRPYIERLYLIFDHLTYEKHKSKLDLECRANNAGIMVLSPKTGYLRSVLKCKSQSVDPEVARLLTIRLAWRAGESKRTRTRRARRYIEQQ